MTRIVLVEDDPTISEPLTRALGREGYDVEWHGTGMGGVGAADEADLVILDLGLPDIDGVDVARRIRDKGLQVPILMLTARADEVDLVVGLDAGADDYVTKPFRLAELLARVRALLRRRVAEDGGGELSVAGVRVDVAGHRAFVDDRELQLSGKEFDLLHLLVANAGSVVSRDTLMREVWEADAGAPSKTLDMHVSWLRRKLGDDASDPTYITTVRGMGFRFENDE
jgi:DNA-binding response OmpR family regulator